MALCGHNWFLQANHHRMCSHLKPPLGQQSRWHWRQCKGVEEGACMIHLGLAQIDVFLVKL